MRLPCYTVGVGTLGQGSGVIEDPTCMALLNWKHFCFINIELLNLTTLYYGLNRCYAVEDPGLDLMGW